MIKCTLDEDECIDLLTVLRVISQINQEQAWAICYEVGQLMKRLPPASCAPIESLAQIHLHKEGFVHEKSCLTNYQDQTPSPEAPATTPSHHLNTEPQQEPPTPPTPPITPELSEILRRRPALNETELVASLGIALFWALDYGIPDDEERKLSIAMEYLIYQSQSNLSLDEILKRCIDRLPVATKAHADSHYREVCKSLVSDTIELAIFLEKIYTASMVLSDITLDDCLEANHKCDMSDDDLSELGEPLASLRALRINDWARLWMQVIRELRQRGKFIRALSVN
mgnify:CR=1 FL=1